MGGERGIIVGRALGESRDPVQPLKPFSRRGLCTKVADRSSRRVGSAYYVQHRMVSGASYAFCASAHGEQHRDTRQRDLFHPLR